MRTTLWLAARAADVEQQLSLVSVLGVTRHWQHHGTWPLAQ